MAGELQRPLWIPHSPSSLSFVVPFPMLSKEPEHSSTAKHISVLKGNDLLAFFPAHSTRRATRSRTDVGLPTRAGFEKQFKRQETRGGGRGHRDKDTHRERQRDTEILRLKEEPTESAISPGCVGRKLGRP